PWPCGEALPRPSGERICRGGDFVCDPVVASRSWRASAIDVQGGRQRERGVAFASSFTSAGRHRAHTESNRGAARDGDPTRQKPRPSRDSQRELELVLRVEPPGLLPAAGAPRFTITAKVPAAPDAS